MSFCYDVDAIVRSVAAWPLILWPYFGETFFVYGIGA